MAVNSLRKEGAGIIVKLMIHVCQQKCTMLALVVTVWVTANPAGFFAFFIIIIIITNQYQFY